MDFVSTDFCESVCSVLSESVLSNFAFRFPSSVWQVLAQEVFECRVNLAVEVSRVAGVWKYNLEKLNRGANHRITFEDLKRLNQRHLHVREVILGKCSRSALASSLDEIYKIVNFTFPLLKRPVLDISSNQMPREARSIMLTRYCNASFSEIHFNGVEKVTEEFLKQQLQCNAAVETMRLLNFGQECSADLRLALEDFAICKPVRILIVQDETLFDRAFFERFFEKTALDLGCEIWSKFSFTFEELKTFKIEHQVDVCEEPGKVKRIVWRRDDRVQVRATDMLDKLWQIKIQRDDGTAVV